MPPATRENLRHRQDQVHAQLGSFDGEAWLLFALSLSAFAILVAMLALRFDLLPSAHTDTLVAGSGVAACIAIALAVGVKRAIDHRLDRIKGVYTLARRRNDTDALTGAVTRNRFIEQLSEALSTRCQGGGSVALVVFDLDHFKQINDSFGHPAGDTVLKFCAEVAGSTFHSATIGRMGGDEFALFIEYGEPIEAAYLDRACSAFLARLRDGFQVGHRRQSVSCSLGIAVAPHDSHRSDILLSHADMALYESKRAGRATWTFFHEDLLAEKRHERFIERELRAAILLQELGVRYQPILTADGRLHAFEALARWHHPVRGMISPADFIPVAERSRLVHDLGMAVLRQVCRDMARLPDVPVNVNVSARQLALEHFQDDYLGILETVGVDPSRIVLEITESSLLDACDNVSARISALKAAGFRIALDDFGMGYSEFNQLRTLPFDVIKIDKSYIQTLGSDPVTDIFVSAVVAVARHSDRAVIAEGIESEADMQRALAAGCGLFQGYLFDKPQTLEAVVAKYTALDTKAA